LKHLCFIIFGFGCRRWGFPIFFCNENIDGSGLIFEKNHWRCMIHFRRDFGIITIEIEKIHI
jgi:hypothetical protein